MVNIFYERRHSCCCCKKQLKSIKHKDLITRIGQKTIENIRTFFNNQRIQINDFICNKCRQKVKNNNTQSNELISITSNLSTKPKILVNNQDFCTVNPR